MIYIEVTVATAKKWLTGGQGMKAKEPVKRMFRGGSMSRRDSGKGRKRKSHCWQWDSKYPGQ